jgi:hypothetical protein
MLQKQGDDGEMYDVEEQEEIYPESESSRTFEESETSDFEDSDG